MENRLEECKEVVGPHVSDEDYHWKGTDANYLRNQVIANCEHLKDGAPAEVIIINHGTVDYRRNKIEAAAYVSKELLFSGFGSGPQAALRELLIETEVALSQKVKEGSVQDLLLS